MVGTGWPIDDLHQLLAIIEEKQGRQPEPKALYFARDGAVFDTETGTLVRDSSGAFQSGWYRDKGVKHLRVPDELRALTPSILYAAKSSKDWASFHSSLQKLGVNYDRKGSGARIGYGSHDATASNVDAALARSQLTKRWGDFVADQSRLDLALAAYQIVVREQLADLRACRDRDCKSVDEWSRATTMTLPATVPAIIRAALQAERDAAITALNAAYKAAIAQHTKARLTAEQWKSAGRPEAPPRVERPAMILPGSPHGNEHSVNQVAGFACRHAEWRTEYYDDQGALMMTDHRVVIVVAAPKSHAAIDAALKLGADRWGNVRVFGSEEFVALANKRAARLGIEVNNAPEQVAPPPIEVAETAAPSVNQEQPQPEQAPVVAHDPAQVARLAELESNLDMWEFVPLSRLEPNRQAGSDKGLLEIAASKGRFWVHYQRIAELCVHDDHPQVQAYLEQRYLKNLDGMERQLLPLPSEKLEGSPASVVALMREDNGMKASAELIQDTAEFKLMVERVRGQIKRRERAEALMRAEHEAKSQGRTGAAGGASAKRQPGIVRPTGLPKRSPAEDRESQWVRERTPYGRDED